MKTYELFTGVEQIIAERILRRRLQMLIHSCIYYELNVNVIDDFVWDKWAKELVELQRDYPEISKQVDWYDAFADWDGSTGAFLPLKHPWVMQKAMWLSGKSVDNRKAKIRKLKIQSAKKKKLF